MFLLWMQKLLFSKRTIVPFLFKRGYEMTSQQLELLYTIAVDNLDALLAVGAISKERYDSRMARLGRWIESKYSEAS